MLYRATNVRNPDGMVQRIERSTNDFLGPEQQKAFVLLKKNVSEEVVLVFPNFNRSFRLNTDASRNGLGTFF